MSDKIDMIRLDSRNKAAADDIVGSQLRIDFFPVSPHIWCNMTLWSSILEPEATFCCTALDRTSLLEESRRCIKRPRLPTCSVLPLYQLD